MKALAHISEDRSRTQTVYEHLSGTAKLAGTFAAAFGARQEAEFAAWHMISGNTLRHSRRVWQAVRRSITPPPGPRRP